MWPGDSDRSRDATATYWLLHGCFWLQNKSSTWIVVFLSSSIGLTLCKNSFYVRLCIPHYTQSQLHAEFSSPSGSPWVQWRSGVLGGAVRGSRPPAVLNSRAQFREPVAGRSSFREREAVWSPHGGSHGSSALTGSEMQRGPCTPTVRTLISSRCLASVDGCSAKKLGRVRRARVEFENELLSLI